VINRTDKSGSDDKSKYNIEETAIVCDFDDDKNDKIIGDIAIVDADGDEKNDFTGGHTYN